MNRLAIKTLHLFSSEKKCDLLSSLFASCDSPPTDRLNKLPEKETCRRPIVSSSSPSPSSVEMYKYHYQLRRHRISLLSARSAGRLHLANNFDSRTSTCAKKSNRHGSDRIRRAKIAKIITSELGQEPFQCRYFDQYLASIFLMLQLANEKTGFSQLNSINCNRAG